MAYKRCFFILWEAAVDSFYDNKALEEVEPRHLTACWFIRPCKGLPQQQHSPFIVCGERGRLRVAWSHVEARRHLKTAPEFLLMLWLIKIEDCSGARWCSISLLCQMNKWLIPLLWMCLYCSVLPQNILHCIFISNSLDSQCATSYSLYMNYWCSTMTLSVPASI